jgi:hypothetical protein
LTSDRDLESTYDPKEKALANRYPLTNRLPANVDHNAQQLTADYLSALKRHLMYMLQLHLGKLQAAEIPLQFILTVPAVWSEIAKEKTLSAAEEAGLGEDASILLVSEPVSDKKKPKAIYGLRLIIIVGSRSNLCPPTTRLALP